MPASTPPSRPPDSGFVLFEALVSILIFAGCLIAMLALEARSFQLSADLRFRAEAMQLSDAFIGEMWAAGLGAVDVDGGSFTSGNAYAAFRAKALQSLPLCEEPQVSINHDASLPASSRVVNVTLIWSDRDNQPHRFTQTSVVALNKVKPDES